MSLTKVIWLNRKGERMEHTMGFKCSYFYALDWFRRSILESQPTAFMSRDERRESKLRLLEVRDFSGPFPPSILGGGFCNVIATKGESA